MATFFSEAARDAAKAGRKRQAELQRTRADIEVFIVRSSPTKYAWELRRFGGIVVARAEQDFDSVALALSAGNAALQVFET